MNDKFPSNQIHEHVGFSLTEKRILVGYCRHSFLDRWSWYFVYLFPMLLFAGYGLLKHDILALAVAFGALFIFVIWVLYSGIKGVEHLRNILAKYDAYIARLETERADPFVGQETPREGTE
ncbi:hypothetical protein U14_00381 [Candidatus Moduliflexus flocculans]|uniref:Uncharacterized protein n=1 Tax=Candidatus Moduliflexus flocculans TaxID=1499966 RepID=A0A0S6VPZ3_9BACT|nr:hypothetical protein U14_00381 [Candidatus Moduliflexus flocculans]